MKVYGVIMAGGGGTRFWPLSRQTKPKQLLNLSGQGLMINETIERISGVIEKNSIFIVTNEIQYEQMKNNVVDGILHDHILSEPAARNTVACIGYAAFEIIKKYGDGIMCIFPADHHIKNCEEFQRVLNQAILTAEETDMLITIGIKPSFPSTGYGYIKYGKEKEAIACDVLEFVEKPNLKLAKQYCESNEYAWNSGMFIWKASTILDNMKRFLPKIYQNLCQIAESMNTDQESRMIKKIYSTIPSISIDYGIMERSDDVKVILGDFGWNDVGSWDTLGELYDIDMDGNVIKGNQINLDTKNCISYAENRFIATVGVEDLIVVETDDAVLVCKKDQAQDVKSVVDMIKAKADLGYLL